MKKELIYTLIACVVIVLSFYYGSCHKQRPTPSNVHEIHDSVVYKETIKVDTLRVPGEKVYIRVPVGCPDGQKPLPVTVHETNGGASVTASIDSTGYLYVTTNCDSLYNIIITKEKLLQQKISVKDSTSTVIVKAHVPKAYKIIAGIAVIETTFFIYKIIKYFKP